MNRCFAGSAIVTVLIAVVAASGEPQGAPTLADAAWLAGPWRNGPDTKGDWEEYWSAPRDGAMIGAFRLKQNTGNLYEFLLIEEDKDGVWMRLRHYRGKMQEMEKEPLRLKLVSAADKKLTFENPDHDQPKRITYRFEAPNTMLATIETQRNGKPASFTLKFVRAVK